MKNKLSSYFKDYLEKYINLKLTCGFTESSILYLYDFDKLLCEEKCDSITKSIVDIWAIQKETESKNTRKHRLSQVRMFCKYLNSLGIEAYIPTSNLSDHKSKPYVLSTDEIVLLFKEIDEYSFTRNNHYKYVLPIFFRLLYTTGLRNNEACVLKVSNLDISKKTILIEKAKNKKDRLVYLHDDMVLLLIMYIKKLELSSNDWLFPSTNQNIHIVKTSIDKYFKEITKNNWPNDYHPVPHSLRHTYVVHKVDSWINEGNDINQLMPYLSKQLGHSSIEETYYYYHAIASSYKIIKENSKDLYPEVRYEE